MSGLKRFRANCARLAARRTFRHTPCRRPAAVPRLLPAGNSAALCLVCWLAAWTGLSAGDESGPLVGQSERVYTLATENSEVRGLALDDSSPQAPRLFALDRSGQLFAYRLGQPNESDQLELLESYDLAALAGAAKFTSPRGLVFAVEDGHGVFYVLNWDRVQGAVRSQLWRFDRTSATASQLDLSLHAFRIGDRETLGLAYRDGRFLLSFDASDYADSNLRVQRGILEITWQGDGGEQPAAVRHLPDAGTLPARGLAPMALDGAHYLWATVGNDQIYCADAQTGRGLFFFDRPRSDETSTGCWGLCFGRDALWVSENVAGPDRVHRVNVTKNLDAHYEGPRVPRRLIMTIRTDPECESADPGAVYHYYSRPYGYEQLHNQGVWPETETVVDLTAVPHASVRPIHHDPAGDAASRQYLQCVEYGSAPARCYASRYEIDLWTNPYRKFVYPHRVNDCRDALQGTDYLADDPELYNLSDTATYAAFTQRVKSHIERKYGVAADMRNPYWAGRNVVEYIQDHYYYPSPDKRKPATVDYQRQHYDANPANLKIELSARDYDKSQIIACSGTSVMVAGAMRYLGIPARWLGTATPHGPATWDANGNGLLDANETASCTNGHRYAQVWLGQPYGWICFDATPSKPAFNDYDPPPPLQSQWRYMNRAAAGHREDRRIVFNVGSGLYRPLYRDYEYDERLAQDNNCGGDQRYNLQGRYEEPALWKRARHDITTKNICFLTQVTLAGPTAASRVRWQLEGAWNRIPDATISLELQQFPTNTDRARDVARLARSVACDAGSVVVDLSAYHGKRFRLILRRDGDPQTGGQSELFDLD